MDIIDIMFIIEIIGTVSFAVSGSLIAIERDCDLFGIIVLGITTAVGGGAIRDLMLGIHPPLMFQYPIYALVAGISSILIFLIFYFNQASFQKYQRVLEWIDISADALGLGIFTIIGINTAISHDAANVFLILFIGLITGVGGGILRDVMAVKMPMVLHKRVYALAALIGGGAYYFCLTWLNQPVAVVLGIVLTVGIRFLAAHYHWNLPKVPHPVSNQTK